MTRLQSMLAGSPYQGYAYAYPHKTAYRPLEQPIPLAEVWQEEQLDSLFLYLHIPFCEMRCGFCNLFTQAGAGDDLIARYLDAVQRQTEETAARLNRPRRITRMALGGGTPTILEPAALERLFVLFRDQLGVPVRDIPVSVETSPATADAARLDVLRQWGVTRISLGVESFEEAETTAVQRPQPAGSAESALDRIREAGFPVLNLDLIYGLPGQTRETWLASLDRALEYQPEEIYLYPLYVRPLTGLGRSGRAWDDQRLDCYRTGRDLLRTAGYEQVSMRMFRSPNAPAEVGPAYCCQTDGMLGLGCGARSYTRGLHYSGEYAVRAQGVRAIIADYVSRTPAEFRRVDYGFQLDDEDRRRRFVMQSLLQADGLRFADYRRLFRHDPLEDLPQLGELVESGLAEPANDALRPTAAGLERSDLIGPWLYSSRVRELMEACEAR